MATLPAAVLSLPRYQASCEGKEAHPSEAGAWAALKFYQADRALRTGDGLEAYKCDFCPDWHLGH